MNEFEQDRPASLPQMDAQQRKTQAYEVRLAGGVRTFVHQDEQSARDWVAEKLRPLLQPIHSQELQTSPCPHPVGENQQ